MEYFFGVFRCGGFTCCTDTKPQYVMWYKFLPKDAKVTYQHDHAIKYVLYHEGKQYTYCKYFDLLLWFLVLLITEIGYHIIESTCVLCCSGKEYKTMSCFVHQKCRLVSFSSMWSLAISRCFLYSDEGNEVDKTDDSSDFTGSEWDSTLPFFVAV